MSSADVRTCKHCGCTDDDCTDCILKTGKPCSWVSADECSACAGPDAITGTEPIEEYLFEGDLLEAAFPEAAEELACQSCGASPFGAHVDWVESKNQWLCEGCLESNEEEE